MKIQFNVEVDTAPIHETIKSFYGFKLKDSYIKDLLERNPRLMGDLIGYTAGSLDTAEREYFMDTVSNDMLGRYVPTNSENIDSQKYWIALYTALRDKGHIDLPRFNKNVIHKFEVLFNGQKDEILKKFNFTHLHDKSSPTASDYGEFFKQMQNLGKVEEVTLMIEECYNNKKY